MGVVAQEREQMARKIRETGRERGIDCRRSAGNFFHGLRKDTGAQKMTIRGRGKILFG